MNKNYFGIRNNNSKSPVFGNFALNRFTCSSELRPTWDKWNYLSGSWSYAGMAFQGCTVTIGSPAPPFWLPTYSLFDNMNNGIIGLDECILSVRNCRFDTLRHTGLVAVNSHLDFEGIQIGTDLESTVTRCGKYGIRAENSQLSVHKTKFQYNNRMAINSALNSHEEFVKITSNFIQNKSTGISDGIFLQRSSGKAYSTNNIISDNQIIITGENTNAIGICISGSNNATDNMTISLNDITVNEYPQNGDFLNGRDNHGIMYSAMNHSGYGVFDQNQILNTGLESPTFVLGYGIAFQNNDVFPHTLKNNSTLAMPKPNAFASNDFKKWNIWCGIHADACSNLIYCNNTSEGCFQGMHKLGANAIDDAVISNTFLSNWRGISQDIPAVYGDQECTHNTFLPINNGVEYYHDDSFRGATNQLNKFYIDQNDLSQNPDPTTDPNWFAIHSSCENKPAPACPEIFGSRVSGDTEYRIATGELFPDTVDSYDGWAGRYKLYTAIKTYPGVYTDTEYSLFVSQYENSGIGKLYETERLIHEGTVYPDTSKARKLEYDLYIDSCLQSARSLDAQMNITDTVNLSLISLKARLIDQIDSVRLLRADLKSDVMADNGSL